MRDDTGNKAGRNNATAKNNLKSIDKMTNQTAERCIKALTLNGFDVRTAATAAEAGEIIRSIIDQTAPASISFGDSMTLYATGTVAWLRGQTQIPFIDTFEPGVPFRDLIERRRAALTCGLFLTGINAVCEDGSLHWLDMIGNRIAPIAFGPRKVVLVAGRNKIVATQEDAYARIRDIAAPRNVARHEGFKTPCAVTGRCHDCSSPQRICNERLILHKCHPKGRITVILIDEELGL